MHNNEPTHTLRKATGRRILLAFATLVAATALSACGGGSGSAGGGFNVPITPGTASPQPGVVVTPNDPATAGPPPAAVTPPGATPDPQPPVRRPETVRCAP